MVAFLTPFLSKFWGYIVAVGAFLAAIATAWISIKKSGEDEQKAADQKQTIKTTQRANDVQNEVASAPASTNRDELRSDWTI